LLYLYENGKRGKGLAAGETERECVCVRDGDWLKLEVALVVKTAVGETDHFGIILGLLCKDYLTLRNYFNGKERLHR
jgi:hypothetical protein